MFELFPHYNETPMTELAMQMPMYSHGSALTPDWNNDGVLDLWHHNHYSFSQYPSRWSDPSTARKGPRTFPGGCMVDWDAVFRNGTDGTYYTQEGGFIEWSDASTDNRCFDTHSTSFLDIDGDGYKDLFIATGGGRGVGSSFTYDNLLFWGTPHEFTPAYSAPLVLKKDAAASAMDGGTGKTHVLNYRLVGGRDAAALAGLRGRDNKQNDRGRHQYWLDVNGDGLLDVIMLNFERRDKKVLPGRLFVNRGGRKFEKMRQGGFAEFAKNMVLTDVDGDGLARELVVPSDCKPRLGLPDDPPKNWVCNKAPRGSVTVYKLNKDNEYYLEKMSVEPRPERHDYVRSITSGDFDNDGFADIAVLWGTEILFHQSRAKRKRCRAFSRKDPAARETCQHQLGKADSVLKLDHCGEQGGMTIRLADFNLDGKMDLLVVCKDPGLHAIYQQEATRQWKLLTTRTGDPIDMGVLNSPTLMLGGDDFCKGVPISDKKALNCLEQHTEEECSAVKYHHQFLICNYWFRNADKPLATAHGATVVDIDNDGFSDVIVGYRRGAMLMLRNTLGDTGYSRFLAIEFDKSSPSTPAMAVGAIVKVQATNMGKYNNETQSQMHVVSSLSHETDAEGGHEDRLIFGLSRRGRVKNIIVHWPHCCGKTTINGKKAKIYKYYRSMTNTFKLKPPKDCDQSCFEGDSVSSDD